MNDYIKTLQSGETPEASLLRQARAELCLHAGSVSVRKFIDIYANNRRLLGYLNRLPHELARYAQTLEGQVRATTLPIGKSVIKPMSAVEETYYEKEDRLHRVKDKYEQTLSELKNTLDRNLRKVLSGPTVVEVVDDWIRLADHNMGGDFSFPSLFTLLFNKKQWLIDRADHARGLADILKNINKDEFKSICRSAICEIEIRFGFEPPIIGLTVVPDVEDVEPLVLSFLSDTAIMNNITQIVNKYPALEPALKLFQENTGTENTIHK